MADGSLAPGAGAASDDFTRDFRGAMRRMAATVTIVTVADAGRPMGMAATAVASLSADPPSMLACINQSASMHGVLGLASHFCINVLHRDQQDVARTFSASHLRDMRFAEGGWTFDASGPPYLPGALASLVCERQQLIAFATHTICIGTVTAVRLRDDIDPLVYLDGAYCAIGS